MSETQEPKMINNPTVRSPEWIAYYQDKLEKGEFVKRTDDENHVWFSPSQIYPYPVRGDRDEEGKWDFNFVPYIGY